MKKKRVEGKEHETDAERVKEQTELNGHSTYYIYKNHKKNTFFSF